MKGSWKTTAAGILAFIAPLSMALSAVLDSKPETVPNWEAVIAALPLLGLGLFARDKNVSSEDEGIK